MTGRNRGTRAPTGRRARAMSAVTAVVAVLSASTLGAAVVLGGATTALGLGASSDAMSAPATTLLTPSTPGRAPAATPTAPTARSWLVLGDSFSSGYGAGATAPELSAWGAQCARATGVKTADGTSLAKAWSVVAADELGATSSLGRPQLHACSGNTTDDWAKQVAEAYRAQGIDIPLPQDPQERPTRSSPTVQAIKAAAAAGHRWDLITLTMGGNNLSYGDLVSGCIDVEQDRSWTTNTWSGCRTPQADVEKQVDALVGRADPARTPMAKGVVPLWSSTAPSGAASASTAADQGDDVESLYDAVSALVRPGGRVVVLGYPQVFEDPAKMPVHTGWATSQRVWDALGGCQGASVAGVDYLRSVQRYFDQGTREAVAKAQAAWQPRGVTWQYLDSATYAFDAPDGGHGLCSATPWVHGVEAGLGTGPSFHPTQAGYVAMGRALAQLLTS